MAMKFPHARYLSNEEVDYELRLRHKEDETRLNLQTKRDVLRKLFQEDRNEKHTYPDPPYRWEDEMNFVKTKVDGLLLVAQGKVESETRSKLLHYYYRIQRAATQSEEGEKMKGALLGPVSKLLSALSADGNLTQSDPERKDPPGRYCGCIEYFGGTPETTANRGRTIEESELDRVTRQVPFLQETN